MDDVNFKDTSKRVARAYREVFSGVKNTSAQIDSILKSKFPAVGYDQMIICKGIVAYSMCPHHFMPVSYTIDIGYIPSPEGSVVGISKLSRVVEVLAHRPIMQETLTRDIGVSFTKIKPIGVAVRVEGNHYCMKMRGVKKEGSILTSFLSGVFREESPTRQEFFNLI